MRAFFEGHIQCSAQTLNKIENGSGVGCQHRLHHQLAVSVEHSCRDGALVDIEADILDAIHRVFLSSGLVYCFAQQPYPTSKGAPFYNACPTHSRVSNVGAPLCGNARTRPFADSEPERGRLAVAIQMLKQIVAQKPRPTLSPANGREGRGTHNEVPTFLASALMTTSTCGPQRNELRSCGICIAIP